jgi:hypothetical protein
VSPGDGDGGGAGVIPEVGSWVMLVSGFGLIGLAMRRGDRRIERRVD